MNTDIQEKYENQIRALPDELEDWRKGWIADNWLREFIYFDGKAVSFKAKNTRLTLTDKYSKSLGVVLATYLASPVEAHYLISVFNLVLMILIVYSTTTLAALRPFEKHQIHRETAEELMEEWRSLSVLQGKYITLGWGDGFSLFHDNVSDLLRSNRRKASRIERAAYKNGKSDANADQDNLMRKEAGGVYGVKVA